ncbi:hypothetical protein FRB94_000289 [Tulasnella sp. JGI-2019a]|nr:hypothetical protein FRB93_003221 [Tulasnella sp. JGI-2019a]KAG9006878.1 hypothetical protein FRB94_000289 [Tulasnella sp. JGI-2019a]KAG9032227.1 hypothetical protein FRB95_001706 [Tulasnella sp. JGI-2019a]
MHSSALLVAFSFLASVYSLAITAPADGAVVSATGSITCSWTSVASDPTSFEIEYIDPTQKISKVVAATVTTSARSIVLSAPSGGWPLGNNWTLRALSLPTTNDAGGGILSQSGNFNITSTGATTGAVPTTMSGASTIAAATTAVTGATTTVAADATGTGTIGASATALNPTGTSGALGLFQVSGTLLAFVFAAHAFMM